MKSFWDGKRVLITGHTGFKGSWLSLILSQLNSKVFGLALEPNTSPALFNQLELAQDIDHFVGDIRDRASTRNRIIQTRPDIIFHLAAQPLVLASYNEPVETWETNVMGTAHILDALKQIDHPCILIVITTDKVYKNNELGVPYCETDTLGGHDPYSASKAAVELVVKSYRDSFFRKTDKVRVATARAGNVIGGGDWAENRIVPDIVRALSCGQEIEVRNPNALRPWQHVIEPLAGYMRLAELLAGDTHLNHQTSYNFGPEPADFRRVSQLVDASLLHWPGRWVNKSESKTPHEAGLLSLNIEKARSELNFAPRWGFESTIGKTIGWYRDVSNGSSPRQRSLSQIESYFQPK